MKVFVYGTLLTGESNHHVAAPFIQDRHPGVVKGRLYNTGSFPAAVLDPDGYEIEGEWFDVTENGLKRMDMLEGYRGEGQRNFYDRVGVKDLHSGTEGYMYVWREASNLPEIKGGSWKKRNEAAAIC